jgi:RNA polymerase sigma-70 factor (ECF subfamily)
MLISENIFDGCKRNDRHSQEELYKSLYVDLIRIGLRYTSNQADAEDLLNRAMLKAFTEIEKFKGNHLNFGAWIKRILINEAIDMIRRKKSFNNKHVVMGVFPNDIFDKQNIENDPSYILKMLDALPLKAKTVFNLYIIEGYKHEEIASKLGISIANSKWNLHLARKKMKGWILKQEHV